MHIGRPGKELVFNHDGCGMVAALKQTRMTEQDAVDGLVKPLAESGITIIDWSILSTAHHNCRTRHGLLYDGRHPRSQVHRDLGEVIQHYAAGPRDLADIVVKHGQEMGMRVLGCLRLNHSALGAEILEGVPGRMQPNNNARKDFRDETFHQYLQTVYEDLLEKGVDGLTLDFERKAPFFADDVPQQERFDACRSFVRRIRKLTDKPLVVRVSHRRDQGEPQGQHPEGWMREGLVDAVVPATHNHEPDTLDWQFARFLSAAAESPRPCGVWPQIWPVPVPWRERTGNLHAPEDVLARGREIFEAGAAGVYFFNFCCFDALPEDEENPNLLLPRYTDTFSQLSDPAGQDA